LCDVVHKGYEKSSKDHEKDGEGKETNGEEKPLWDETEEMQYQQNKNKDFTAHTFIQ